MMEGTKEAFLELLETQLNFLLFRLFRQISRKVLAKPYILSIKKKKHEFFGKK